MAHFQYPRAVHMKEHAAFPKPGRPCIAILIRLIAAAELAPCCAKLEWHGTSLGPRIQLWRQQGHPPTRALLGFVRLRRISNATLLWVMKSSAGDTKKRGVSHLCSFLSIGGAGDWDDLTVRYWIYMHCHLVLVELTSSQHLHQMAKKRAYYSASMP